MEIVFNLACFNGHYGLSDKKFNCGVKIYSYPKNYSTLKIFSEI